jgi:hypothetical protein
MLLKQLKYFLPHAGRQDGKHRRPLRINIDFEKGVIQISGNYRHALASARQGIESLPEWVQINASIYPSETLELQNSDVTNVVLAVDGQLNDGMGPYPCAGLLVLEAVNNTGGWDLTLYLYDQLAACREVRIRLPLPDNSDSFYLN